MPSSDPAGNFENLQKTCTLFSARWVFNEGIVVITHWIYHTIMLPSEIFTDLIHKSTLLVTLAFGYWIIIFRLKDVPPFWLHLIQGVLFGVFAIINMLDPITLAPGVFIDGRGVVIAIAGVQGGIVAAVASALIVSVARIDIGGVGVVSALATIWLTMLVGVGAHHYVRSRLLRFSQLFWMYLLLGFACVLVMFVTMYLLPLESQGVVAKVFRLPVLLILPFMSTTLGLFLHYQDEYVHTLEEQVTEKNMLDTLIENVPDYIFIKDTQLRFLFSNTAHARAAGMSSSQDLIGKTAEQLFPEDLALKYRLDDENVLTGSSIIGEERISVDEHGRPISVSTTKVPFYDNNGHVRGVIGISRNISEQKLREKQRQDLENERQRMWLMKTFIQNVSHDFRTPLSVIFTNIHLLRRVEDPTQREHKLAQIEVQANHITHLLDDMMKLVMLDSETVEFTLHRFDLSILLRQIIGSLQPQIDAKAHTITLNLQKVSMVGDEVHLNMALQNLITNAISYTPQGGTITVTLSERDDYAIISVQDTGIGISEGELNRIFERLYRVDQARSVNTGGTGLGLPISKSIIESHGGQLTVESIPERGSTFYVRLPKHPAHAVRKGETVSAPNRSKPAS